MDSVNIVISLLMSWLINCRVLMEKSIVLFSKMMLSQRARTHKFSARPPLLREPQIQTYVGMWSTTAEFHSFHLRWGGCIHGLSGWADWVVLSSSSSLFLFLELVSAYVHIYRLSFLQVD